MRTTLSKASLPAGLDPKAGVRNRGKVVFDAMDSRVTDHQDHFELNTEGQARNALARAAQYDSSPPWFKGTLAELQAAVRRAVARAFPGINVSKAEQRRRIKAARVTHVSLCARGKNRMPVLMKSGGRVAFECLTKASEGLLYALVYVPEENGAIDSDGDGAPAEVVKAMAHDFLANGGNIDIEHNLQPLSTDQVRIAETLIVQKGDERFAGFDYNGKPVDPTGSWGMVLKLLDPEIRKAAEDGLLNGLSLFGQAEVEILKADPTPNPNQEEFDMTPEQMTQFADILAKALKPAAPATPEPVQKAEIKFEGDPTNLEDIAKHEDKVFMASLDLSKAEDVAKLRARVEAKKAQAAAPAAPTEPANPRIAELEAELAQLRKASGAPAGKAPEQPAQSVETGLKKAEADQFAAGKALAKAFQKSK